MLRVIPGAISYMWLISYRRMMKMLVLYTPQSLPVKLERQSDNKPHHVYQLVKSLSEQPVHVDLLLAWLSRYLSSPS